MRLLIFALVVAACAASCPNDCNGNGVCNIYSACECYRNWMGADCSQRVCYFGHAFIDTPQGDLNADGRVDRADVFGVEIVSKWSFSSYSKLSDATDADRAYAEALVFNAGQYINAAGGTASEIDNKGTVMVTATGKLVMHTDGKVHFGFTLPVATNTGKAPTFPWQSGSCTVDSHTTKETCEAASEDWTMLHNGGDVYFLPLENTNSGSSGEYSQFGEDAHGDVSTAVKDAFGTTISGDDLDFEFVGTGQACTTTTDSADCESYDICASDCQKFEERGGVKIDVFRYPTQFTNQKTWERYPENHGVALDDNTLKSYWDEAHFYAECSGKGQCDRSSGSCECFVGYEGEGCTRTSCPSSCSGHGVCSLLSGAGDGSIYNLWDADKTQACDCDSGYQGIDCAQRICPKGDDPITRPASEDSSVANLKSLHPNQWDAEFDRIDHLLPNGAGQVTEIQTFGYVNVLDTTEEDGVFSNPNSFALEFTDEFGEKWVTKTLDWRTASAKDVEDVLEALPNKVVENVQVGVSYFSDSETNAGVAADCSAYEGESNDLNPCNTGNSELAYDSPSSCCAQPRVWSVTFSTNSGDVEPLGVRSKITITDGDDPVVDDEGKFHKLAYCESSDDSTITTTPCLMQRATDSYQSINNMIELLGSDLLLQENEITGEYEYTDHFSDLTPDSYFNVQSASFGTCYGVYCTDASSTSDDVCVLNGGTWNAPTDEASCPTTDDQNDDAGVWRSDVVSNAYQIFITEARKGSQENAECSNRGLCDYDTGLCKCFNGFTDDDCSVQNALAMY